MIYGQLKKPGRKNGYNLSKIKPGVKVTNPVIGDHLGRHINALESNIAGIYESDAPARVRVRALSNSLSKIATLKNLRRARNAGLYKINHKQRPPKKKSKKKTKKNAPRERGNNEDPLEEANDYTIRRLLFDDDPGDETLTSMRARERQNHLSPKQQAKHTPKKITNINTGQLEKNPYWLRKHKTPQTGRGARILWTMFKKNKNKKRGRGKRRSGNTRRVYKN